MVPRHDPSAQQSHYRPSPPSRLPSTSTKRSFRSHSSSFEADDERSTSGGEDDEAGMGPSGRNGRAQYAGEDTRLTSTKELFGWYTYGFAAEVFVICGMGSFIPITLEQLARENGVLLKDRSTPCGASLEPSTPLEATLMGRRASAMAKDAGQCVINILGVEVNTASFAMYTFSISVALQALVVISISCAADHGNYRKRLLLFFAFTGSVATMLFLPITPPLYLLSALFAIIANTCLGASFVLLNSFLPLLVRHHPQTQLAYLNSETSLPQAGNGPQDAEAALEHMDTDTTLVDSTAALLPAGAPIPSSLPKSPLVSVELQLSTHISSRGIGISYSAALLLQCASIFILILLKSSTFALCLVIFLIGAWWFVFTIPAAVALRPRPGPPLPSIAGGDDVDDDDDNSADPSSRRRRRQSRSWAAYVAYSWLSLFRTARLAGRLRDILLFLAAWFLISDAIATVSGTAVLFAKTQLEMAPAALALINVISTTSGVLGAFGWTAASRALRLRPHQTILACILLFEAIPLYGLLGYLPAVRRLGFLGLQRPWEMYPLGAVYGLVLGGLSSYCRSLFGELIPPGSEAAFYALYAITDKGSSVFGPAIVGAIVDATGEIRPAFWFLAVLVGAPAGFIYFLNVERGKREAAQLADVIEGFRGAAAAAAAQRGDRGRDDEVEGLLADEAEDAHRETD